MSGPADNAATRPPRRWMGVVLLVSVGILGFIVGRVAGKLDAAMLAAEVREQEEAERAARAEEREKATRASIDSLRARLEAAQKRIAELEAEERARQVKAAESARMEREVRVALIKRLGESATPAEAPAAPREETRREPVDPPAAPPIPPPQRSLGPTAVTDAGQVRKAVDSLNALLAKAGSKETWRVASADAIDGDRLVGALLEGRTAGGEVARAYRAAEARFVLLAASRSLEVRMRDGEAVYAGERRVPFLDGRYTLVLEVDPDPIRNSANPLIVVR